MPPTPTELDGRPESSISQGKEPGRGRRPFHLSRLPGPYPNPYGSN